MVDIKYNGDASRLMVKVAGDLDRSGMEKLRPSLDKIDSQSFPELVFDFTAVGFIGTTGITFLLEVTRSCTSRGQKVQVMHTPPPIRELFDSLYLDKVITYS